MSQKSRRENRRNRPRRERPVPAASALRVLIVTQPTTTQQAGVDLSPDIALVKSALLYADSVELVSPATSMVSAAGALRNASLDDALAFALSVDDGSGLTQAQRAETAQVLSGMVALRRLSPEQRRRHGINDEKFAELDAIVRQLETARGQMSGFADHTVAESGLQDLELAIKHGVVNLSSPTLRMEDDSDALIEHMRARLMAALQDPSVHAVFDSATSSLARTLIKENLVEANRLTLVHAKQAAIGGGLIARLPSFPDAHMEDVLGLRSDLRIPLRRYRRTVAAMSTKVQAQAFDAESAVEIDDLWRNDVEPALEELREGLERHAFVKTFARQVGTDTRMVATGATSAGALLVGLQTAAGIADAVTALGGVGAAGTVGALGAAGVQAATASGRERRTIKQNDLFYLHEVNGRLRA